MYCERSVEIIFTFQYVPHSCWSIFSSNFEPVTVNLVLSRDNLTLTNYARSGFDLAKALKYCIYEQSTISIRLAAYAHFS